MAVVLIAEAAQTAAHLQAGGARDGDGHRHQLPEDQRLADHHRRPHRGRGTPPPFLTCRAGSSVIRRGVAGRRTAGVIPQ
ncbi:MAG: hypothetical protein R3F43_32700 [bacterium]